MLPPTAAVGLLATARNAVSGLQPASSGAVHRRHDGQGAIHSHALSPPASTARAQLRDAPGPELFTIHLSVSHTAAVATMHVEGDGSQQPVGGRLPPGTMANFALSEFIVPRDYHGNIAFNNAGFRVDTGDESLLEFSFRNQGGLYTPDIDVSYVDGFSIPISCSCSNDGQHAAGCSQDLWSLQPCPDDNGEGSCRNPRRYEESNQTPTDFFAPCHRYGGAYTYPDDNLANTLNGSRCRDSVGATCCIGNLCEAWDDLPR